MRYPPLKPLLPNEQAHLPGRARNGLHQKQVSYENQITWPGQVQRRVRRAFARNPLS